MIRKVKKDNSLGYTLSQSDILGIHVELRQGEIWQLENRCTNNYITCRKGRNEITISKKLAEEIFDLGEQDNETVL